MFQSALIESTHALRSNRRWPALISFMLQAVCAAALLALPMLHPEVLTPRSISLPLAPPLPAPRPPQQPPQHVRLQPADTAMPAITVMTTQPPVFSTQTVSLNKVTDGPPVTGPIMMSGGGGNAGHGIPGLDTAPASANVRIAPSASHAGPANISRGVAEGLLLTPIRPQYPRIAVAAHVSGTVTVAAIISRTGAIESARAVSGPEMLRGAAVDAVREARYRPYLLNGQPTEVQATYTINFTLN